MKIKIQLNKTYADLMVTAQNVVTKSGHLNDIDNQLQFVFYCPIYMATDKIILVRQSDFFPNMDDAQRLL